MTEISFSKNEKRILKFWQKDKIFKKSILQRRGNPNFVFFEGPPYANGRPGIHHFLVRAFKDLICRYKTMKGFRVLRKAGWDTHGLPTEMEVEKRLKIASKREIEKLGIKKFIKECEKNIFIYKEEWEKFTKRIGYWLDLENAYVTCKSDYIETLWWILKKVWQERLLYHDFKVIPYCPRCGTSLSIHEVAQGYKKIREPAVYLKFRIKNPEFKNSYLLVWTTTPWTLPANVAVAINPKFSYLKLKINNEYIIVAKKRKEKCGLNGEIIEEIRGKDLIGLVYQSPFDFYNPNYKTERIYEVIGADFVSLEEGTGLVHIAPAFGQDDMELIKRENKKPHSKKFPILITVNLEGKFTLDVRKWAGMFVKEADPLIIEDLKKRGILFKEELYLHDYPFCWRCKTPLLYLAKKSWFIKTTKVKRDLIKNNQKIHWIPSHLKKGRFGEWLRGVRDWTISRERYWGTPLPIWQCQSCQNTEVIGSLNELFSQRFSTNNYFILRHGDSLRQIKRVAVCWPEKTRCPLTKKGEIEVERAAKKLKRLIKTKKKIDLIFSSDLLRTKQTAEIIKREIGGEIIFDRRLREWNVGIFNNKKTELVWDYLSKKGNLIDTKLPRGESIRSLGKRMYGFLKDVNQRYQNKNVLIISHELPLTILEQTLNKNSAEEILDLRKKGKIKKIKTGEVRKIKFKSFPFNEKSEIDLHRPYIDEVKFFCRKCGSIMERIPEVSDCWFDSGAMPFAQYHYPFENRKLIDKKIQFPADFICEGIDQTRGWFFTLLVISTLLKKGIPYKNVISTGLVLDENGEKMSKSRGNVVSPWQMAEKYGADSIRWYFYTINQPGDPKLFSEKDISQALKKFILIFWNSFSFFQTYSQDFSRTTPRPAAVKGKNILDQWILSRLNELILNVTNLLEEYDITEAARSIERFTIDDLSLWYIRRSRARFQNPDDHKDFQSAKSVLRYVLFNLAKLTAPFIPFLAEEIFQKLGMSKEISVHLTDWPRANKNLIKKSLNRKMIKVRDIVARALAERAKFKIKIRQPLSELTIDYRNIRSEKELINLIKDEVNVKKVTFGRGLKLDRNITPALKEEGMVREFLRNIQEMRKKAGYKPKTNISVFCYSTDEMNKVLKKNIEMIQEKGKIKKFYLEEKKKRRFDIEQELEIDKNTIWVGIKKQ